MKVLVTCACADGSPVARAVAQQLHDIGVDVTTSYSTRSGTVCFGQEAADIDPSVLLSKGFTEIIHAPVWSGAGAGSDDWLDACTRSTYNLLLAASNSGTVERVTIISSMAQFLSYPSTAVIGSHWAPLPSTDPLSLGPHLAEFVAKQFSRAGVLRCLIVRVGDVSTDTDTVTVTTQQGGRFTTTAADAADAIIKEIRQQPSHDALRAKSPFTGPNPSRWQVLHVHDTVDTRWHAVDAPAPQPAARTPTHVHAPPTKTRVLILGAKGFLGPHLLDALEPDHYDVVVCGPCYSVCTCGCETLASSRTIEGTFPAVLHSAWDWQSHVCFALACHAFVAGDRRAGEQKGYCSCASTNTAGSTTTCLCWVALSYLALSATTTCIC